MQSKAFYKTAKKVCFRFYLLHNYLPTSLYTAKLVLRDHVTFPLFSTAFTTYTFPTPNNTLLHQAMNRQLDRLPSLLLEFKHRDMLLLEFWRCYIDHGLLDSDGINWFQVS